jgi:hypothetical protein
MFRLQINRGEQIDMPKDVLFSSYSRLRLPLRRVCANPLLFISKSTSYLPNSTHTQLIIIFVLDSIHTKLITHTLPISGGCGFRYE